MLHSFTQKNAVEMQILPVLFRVPDNPQNRPSSWGSRLSSNTWFLGLSWVIPPIASCLVQSFLQGSLTWPTDTHTHTHTQREIERERDRSRYCLTVCSNRPHLAIAAMRPKTSQLDGDVRGSWKCRRDFSLRFCVQTSFGNAVKSKARLSMTGLPDRHTSSVSVLHVAACVPLFRQLK